ncbi:TROVE domain-containing protein [Bernardetia sp.]|uniref:TROVE domain-containing protein n=1 Tax=Bernardetia sp. TaxID=1937974 RepID=UPI0025C4FE8F|nr:TROVE domain-containing protein [Bernardetia sp.]
MRFNSTTKRTHITTNYEGAKAYSISPALELYSAVVTSSLSNTFYEATDDRISRLRKLIAQNDPLFVAKLAVYAREKMYLRSIPLVLAVELAKVHKGNDLVSRLVSRIVKRADEITELLAYYQAANKRSDVKKLNRLSKQLQKGLAISFNRFDEYQFAKYNRDTEIRLRDALFLVHPKAKDESQQMLFNKIVEDTLQVPYTWEVELSRLGQSEFANEIDKQNALREKWQELIDSGKLGYMALLRNLRNMLQSNVSKEHIKKVAQRLSNQKEVERSKQLPFRFLSAFRELEKQPFVNVQILLSALEEAVKISIRNLKGFDENTSVLIACDVSGSMQFPISPRSSVLGYDIGLVLGMLLQHRSESVISGLFGDTWKVINLPKGNILSNVQNLRKREGEVGYSTNGYLVIKDILKRKQKIDKVMIFTDCQLWNSNYSKESISDYWNQYKKEVAPNAKLYLFDLQGYGKMPLQLKTNDVSLVAGWSDKVFEVMEAIENGQDTLSQIQELEF